MRYYFDTEFIDGEFGLQLISIGVCAQDGREFYAVSDIYTGGCNTWMRENVLARLQPKNAPRYRAQPLAEIKADLLAFVGGDASPEFWAYYGAHDWVALTWLMGGMMSMPQGWPMVCIDLRRELDRCGRSSVKDDGRDDEHNALADARWVRSVAQEMST